MTLSESIRHHNLVIDALSRKVGEEYVAAIFFVESDLLNIIKENAVRDVTYQKLVQQVNEGIVRRYWLEDDLL